MQGPQYADTVDAGLLGGYQGQPRNNYFQERKNEYDTVRYRTAGKQVVQELLESLRGALYDERGVPIVDKNGRQVYDEKLRCLSDEGIRAVKAYLEANASQITSMTNYNGEDRVNRQQIYYARGLARMIITRKKAWGLKSNDLVQLPAEAIMYDSRLKAVNGFENNNISRSWVVSENIDSPQQQQMTMPQKPGFWGGLFGGGRR